MTAIALRRLTRSDLPLLSGWLRLPHVARWWNEDAAPAAVEARYGPSIDGSDPTEVFLILHGGRPVGFLQRYAFGDEPDYRAELEPVVHVSATDHSLDYFVGEPDALRRGVASGAVMLAVADLWREQPEAEHVVVPVHADNLASRRVLERAGFRLVAEGELEPDNPSDDRRHVVFRIDRHATSSTSDRNGRIAL
ncbi:GNAT family N-acetyltransferase [Amnibacterium flavum]|uniref:Lysine N-acyltransferase MbtK n=1 Tax=Amnibacterium flavum TaxID=2173173 RepID=A0A2V1HQW5_9MICO|nr:GNAT family N-acetyltransferase [Amnibacterium flavum]PVZ94032.1 GNAT family N-acetyltransferase [Amnibacterium flavum]